jgi:hypothetical protein
MKYYFLSIATLHESMLNVTYSRAYTDAVCELPGAVPNYKPFVCESTLVMFVYLFVQLQLISFFSLVINNARSTSCMHRRISIGHNAHGAVRMLPYLIG